VCSSRTIRCIALSAVFLTAWSTLGTQTTSDDWRHADEATVRLGPDAFPALPLGLRTALVQRGCTIPQPYASGGQKKKNVITGEFTSAGQTDWAVLCSREKRSAILLFRGGRSDQVDSLAEAPDAQYLQVVASGREIGYSRLIAVATPALMRRHSRKGTLRAADHDGIENMFLGKASVVWYRSGGKWIQVSWSD
jgi:hypothetical protein